jgi:hypothetical protein
MVNDREKFGKRKREGRMENATPRIGVKGDGRSLIGEW